MTFWLPKLPVLVYKGISKIYKGKCGPSAFLIFFFEKNISDGVPGAYLILSFWSRAQFSQGRAERHNVLKWTRHGQTDKVGYRSGLPPKKHRFTNSDLVWLRITVLPGSSLAWLQQNNPDNKNSLRL